MPSRKCRNVWNTAEKHLPKPYLLLFKNTMNNSSINRLCKLAFINLLFAISLFSCNSQSEDFNSKPEDNRFTKVVLTEGMDEPMEMTFLPERRILFVERKGAVKVYDEKTGEMTQVGFVPVNTKYTNKEGVVREAEEGLMGVIADPNYDKNNWIYINSVLNKS